MGEKHHSDICIIRSILFTQVFLPLLSFNHHKDSMKSPAASAARQRTAPDGKRVVEPAKQAALRDEFLISMEKFSAGIHRTIQQIEGEVKTTMDVCSSLFLLFLLSFLGAHKVCRSKSRSDVLPDTTIDFIGVQIYNFLYTSHPS